LTNSRHLNDNNFPLVAIVAPSGLGMWPKLNTGPVCDVQLR